MKIVFILLFVTCCLAAESPKVKTAQGALAGTTVTTRGGREVFAFLGIPYAAPPIGDLRFKSPQPVPAWEGVRDASKEGNECIQQYVIVERIRNVRYGSEDCLYLNVFTPKLVRDAQLPVMVFIHGGAYSGGSGAKRHYGPDLLLDRDVVLVTINYRLGALGFLSTGDSIVPGNMGLKDQLAALRWVQQNIQQFGGDKDSVTIFGESAGGASVQHIILSPKSKGLVHRAISQSGSALSPWAYSGLAYQKRLNQKLATVVGCPNTSSQALHDCLIALPADTIVGSLPQFMEWDMDPVVQFNPTIEPEYIEDAVFTKDPWTLTSDIPWMLGFNENEGNLKTAGLTYGDVSGKLKQLNENFDYLLPMSLYYQHTAKNPHEVTKAIRKMYFGDAKEITIDMVPNIDKLYTDAWFAAGLLEGARHHNGPVFIYYFTYNISFSLCSEYYGNPMNMGVCHFDELMYLFPMEGHFPKKDIDNPDYQMSLKMIQLWTNFARNKTPRLDNQEFWHSTNGSSKDYLLISREGLTLQQHVIEERDKFWQSLPYREKPLLAHRKSVIADEL